MILAGQDNRAQELFVRVKHVHTKLDRSEARRSALH
jgi:hypothetical protein